MLRKGKLEGWKISQVWLIEIKSLDIYFIHAVEKVTLMSKCTISF
jgi:hypothetical protein